MNRKDWADELLPDGNRLINLSTGEEEIMQPITKMYECEVKDFSEKDKSFTAIASTESIDRDGDILRANGWTLKNYRKNPSFLWSHDAYALPLGISKETWVEDKKLNFRPQFATDIYPFADMVWKMYKDKFLRSFSVRFDPIKSEDRELTDEEKERYKNTWRKPQEFKSQELLEISAVNIGSNPEATKSANMIDFIVKSYFARNPQSFPNFDFNKPIWNGFDSNILDFNKNTKPEFECECIECGHKMTTDKHCKDLECPECGGQMRRAERPGPGQANYDFEELKEKREKLEGLLRERELRKAEQSINEEIKNLESEIENEKAIFELQEKLNVLQDGITGLVKK